MRPRLERVALCAAIALASVTACGAPPVVVTPPLVAPQWQHARDAAGGRRDTTWWRGFGDWRLDSLVTLARVASTDLAAASGRLAAAEAALQRTRGSLAPQATARTNATRSRQVIGTFGALDLDVLGATLDASWELDLTGRLRADRRASLAELRAAGYDVVDVRRTITGRVVRGWHDVVGLAARHRATTAAVAMLEETLALVSARARAGVASPIDVEGAAAAVAETRASLPQLHADLVDAVGALAVLAATDVATVTALLDGATLGRALPDVPDAGVPADLLRARPDVRRAEWRVQAAAARVTSARAALRPSFSLAGSVGVNRTNGVGAGIFSVGPSLALPFLDPAARARVVERRAEVLQADAAWRGAVIAAARDVEVAFARARDESERLNTLGMALRRRAVVDTLAQVRWRAGRTDFRDVLEARRACLDAEEAWVRQRVAVAQAVAAMHVALGDPDAGPVAMTTTAPSAGRP